MGQSQKRLSWASQQREAKTSTWLTSMRYKPTTGNSLQPGGAPLPPYRRLQPHTRFFLVMTLGRRLGSDTCEQQKRDRSNAEYAEGRPSEARNFRSTLSGRGNTVLLARKTGRLQEACAVLQTREGHLPKACSVLITSSRRYRVLSH